MPTPPMELRDRVRAAGYTPAGRDVPALVALLADEALATAVIRALTKVPPQAVPALTAAWRHSEEATAARMIDALAALAHADAEGPAVTALIEVANAAQAAERPRRYAITALGKLGHAMAPARLDEVATVLRMRWSSAPSPAETRVLVAAMGKLPRPELHALIASVTPGNDAELARVQAKALLHATRDTHRETRTATAQWTHMPASAATIEFRCKHGMGPLLEAACREQFGALLDRRTARLPREDRLRFTLQAAWPSLFAVRLWSHAAYYLPLPAFTDDHDLATQLVATLRASPLVAWLAAAAPTTRWRLGYQRGGHQRTRTLTVARAISAAWPQFVNDPKQSDWELELDLAPALHGPHALRIWPKLAEPRWTWRQADVPASSHPTVAAALARVGAPTPEDIIWDPFVGAGAELFECANLARGVRLIGSDLSQDALSAARQNAALAEASQQFTLELHHGDATTWRPTKATLIITNPPLGGRVAVDAPRLLSAMLANAHYALAPGGRLVWITPNASLTDATAQLLGWRRTYEARVDLGGHAGHLQRWERPA